MDIPIKTNWDSTDGSLSVEVDGSRLLLVKLQELKEIEMCYRPEVYNQIIEAIEGAYREGYWAAKKNAIDAVCLIDEV